jgi:hypothetical protein
MPGDPRTSGGGGYGSLGDMVQRFKGSVIYRRISVGIL